MGAGLAPRKHWRGRGFNGKDRDVLVFFPEHLSHTGDRAACSDTGNECIHSFRTHLFDDLFCRGAAVGPRVRGIAELVGLEVFLTGCHDLIGLRDRSFHAFFSGSEHKLSAIGFEQSSTLDRHGLRHGQDDRVAFDRCDHGETDARITARRLHDLHAFFEDPLFFRFLDHGEGRPVLDTPSGVEPFKLCPHLGIAGTRQFIELDHWRVPDQVQHCFNLRHVSPFRCLSPSTEDYKISKAFDTDGHRKSMKRHDSLSSFISL
jgi:hypothetical protein